MSTASIILCFGDAQVQNLESISPAVFATLSGVVVVTDEAVRPSFPCVLVEASTVQGFNAGANRDKGLQAASELHPGCDVIFLDGDCIPGPSWTASHVAALSQGVPTVTCGARTQGGGPDPRALPLVWQGQSFAPSMGAESREPAIEEITAHRATWSCNLGINRAAITKLQEAGMLLHGSTRIFSPEFDGRWGGEDTALGIVAYHAGCRVVVLPESSSVEHIPHNPFLVSRINLDRIPGYAELAQSLIRRDG